MYWMAAKRVLRYLKGSKDLELCYTKEAGDVKLYGSENADWAGDLDDRRSTTGCSFYLQKAGAAISWSSKKQPTAAISTSEAEYQQWQQRFKRLNFSMRRAYLLTDQLSSRRTTKAVSRCARVL